MGLNETSRNGYAPWIALACGVAICAGVAGCADHRISLDQFLEMQKEQADVAIDQPVTTQPVTSQPATSQPADEGPDAYAMVDQLLGPYKVGPSDVLGVVFATSDNVEPVAPLQVRVDDEGNVEMPMVGQIKVGGMTLGQVENAIQKAHVPKFFRNAVVYVQLIEPDVRNVLVVGAVTQPGFVQLRRNELNVLHAIVSAGGVSELASGEVELQRLRKPDKKTTVKVTEPEGLQAALALQPLQSGDIVKVHAAKPNTMFVGGLVNAPRPQTYPAGVDVTVLQAIAASGGLRTDVTPREATLIRRMPDGEDVHVRLDLHRLRTGRDPNIKLAAGDILWVPETIETRVQDWVNRNIYFRAGVAATVSYNVSGIEYMNRHGQQGSSGGGGGGDAQSSFDPFGFLNRNSALQNITRAPVITP